MDGCYYVHRKTHIQACLGRRLGACLAGVGRSTGSVRPMSGPQKGQPALEASALAEATSVLLAELPALSPREAERVARSVVRAYLLTLRLSGWGSRAGAFAKRLAGMEVGQRVEAEGWDIKRYGGAKRTARRLMGNATAAWALETRQGRLWIERLGDGSAPPRNGRPARPQARELASMRVGDVRTFPKRRLEACVKASARRIADAPRAQWVSRWVGERLEVRRIR